MHTQPPPSTRCVHHAGAHALAPGFLRAAAPPARLGTPAAARAAARRLAPQRPTSLHSRPTSLPTPQPSMSSTHMDKQLRDSLQRRAARDVAAAVALVAKLADAEGAQAEAVRRWARAACPS